MHVYLEYNVIWKGQRILWKTWVTTISHVETLGGFHVSCFTTKDIHDTPVIEAKGPNLQFCWIQLKIDKFAPWKLGFWFFRNIVFLSYHLHCSGLRSNRWHRLLYYRLYGYGFNIPINIMGVGKIFQNMFPQYPCKMGAGYLYHES